MACQSGISEESDLEKIGNVSLRGPCALDEKVGHFEIAHRELFSAVTGEVSDSVNPLRVLETVEEQGDCRILRQNNPFCDPPCSAGEICSRVEECIPYPRAINVGPVKIVGLTSNIELVANNVNQYQETNVSNPPFVEGNGIKLVSIGTEPFTLYGQGVAPIQVSAQGFKIARGEELRVSGLYHTGPGSVLVTINVDQHGNSPVTLFCETKEELESMTIHRSIIDSLLDYGISGVASANIYRRTVDSVHFESGCVELSVFSQKRISINVE